MSELSKKFRAVMAGGFLTIGAVQVTPLAMALPVLSSPIFRTGCAVDVAPPVPSVVGDAHCSIALPADFPHPQKTVASASVHFDRGGSVQVSASNNEFVLRDQLSASFASLFYRGAFHGLGGPRPEAFIEHPELANSIQVPIKITWSASNHVVDNNPFPAFGLGFITGSARAFVSIGGMSFGGNAEENETISGVASAFLPSLGQFLLDPEYFFEFEVSKSAECFAHTFVGAGESSCHSFADPQISFDQSAFDIQMATLGLESFSLNSLLAIAYAPGITEGQLNAVSLPSTMFLLALGLGGLWATGNRRTL